MRFAYWCSLLTADLNRLDARTAPCKLVGTVRCAPSALRMPCICVLRFYMSIFAVRKNRNSDGALGYESSGGRYMSIISVLVGAKTLCMEIVLSR